MSPNCLSNIYIVQPLEICQTLENELRPPLCRGNRSHRCRYSSQEWECTFPWYAASGAQHIKYDNQTTPWIMAGLDPFLIKSPQNSAPSHTWQSTLIVLTRRHLGDTVMNEKVRKHRGSVTPPDKQYCRPSGGQNVLHSQSPALERCQDDVAKLQRALHVAQLSLVCFTSADSFMFVSKQVRLNMISKPPARTCNWSAEIPDAFHLLTNSTSCLYSLEGRKQMRWLAAKGAHVA